MTSNVSNRLDSLEIEIKKLLKIQKKTLDLQPDIPHAGTIGDDEFAIASLGEKPKLPKNVSPDITPQKLSKRKTEKVRNGRKDNNIMAKFLSVSETITSPITFSDIDSCISQRSDTTGKHRLGMNVLGNSRKSRSAERPRGKDKTKAKVNGIQIIKHPQKSVRLELENYKNIEEVIKLKNLLLQLNRNASLAKSLTKQYKEKFNGIKDATKKKNEKLSNKNETLLEALSNEKAALKTAKDDITKYKNQINYNKETIQYYKNLLNEKQAAIRNLVKSARSSKDTSDCSRIENVSRYANTRSSPEVSYSDQIEKNGPAKKKITTTKRKKSPVMPTSSQDTTVSMHSEKCISSKRRERVKKNPNVKRLEAANKMKELSGSMITEEVFGYNPYAGNNIQQIYTIQKTVAPFDNVNSGKYDNLLVKKYSAFKRLEDVLKIKDLEKCMCKEKLRYSTTEKQQSKNEEKATVKKLQEELILLSNKYNKLSQAKENLNTNKQLEEVLLEKSNAVQMLDEALKKVKDNEKLENDLHILNEKYKQLKKTNEELARELINKNKTLIETKADVEKELSVQKFKLSKSYQEIKQLKSGLSRQQSRDDDYYARELEAYKSRENEYNKAMSVLESKIKALECEQCKLKQFSDEGLQKLIAKNQCLQKQYNELYEKMKMREVDHLQKCECFEQGLDQKKKLFGAEKDELKLLVQELSDVIRTQKTRINYLLSKNQQQKIVLFSQKYNLEDMRKKMNQHTLDLDIVKQRNCELENNLKALKESETFVDSVDNSHQVECLRKQIDEEMAKVRIKDKVIEDQANSISELKQKSADFDCLVKTKKDEVVRKELKITNLMDEVAVLAIDLKQEVAKNEYLTENLTEMQNSKNILTLKVKDLENHMENYCTKIPKHMEKQNDIIRNLELRIMAQRQDFEVQRESFRIEREQAIKAAKFSTDKLMETMQDFQKQTDSQNQIRNVLTSMLQEKDDKLKSAIVQMSAITFAPEEIKAMSQGKICNTRALGGISSGFLNFVSATPYESERSIEASKMDLNKSQKFQAQLDTEPETQKKQVLADLSSYLSRNFNIKSNEQANQNEIDTLLYTDTSFDKLYPPDSVVRRICNDTKKKCAFKCSQNYLYKVSGDQIIPILPVNKRIAHKFLSSSSSNDLTSSAQDEYESFKSLKSGCICKTKFCTCCVLD